MAHMAHRIGLEHDRDQVVLAGRLRLAVPQFLEGGAHLIGDGEPRLAFLERVEALDIAERVGPGGQLVALLPRKVRSEEHTSELQSLMRSSYAVFCLKKKKKKKRDSNNKNKKDSEREDKAKAKKQRK